MLILRKLMKMKKMKKKIMNNRFLFLIGMLVFIVINLEVGMKSCNGSKEEKAWQKVIEYHMQKYPRMEFVDLYKLIYQGTLGPAHLGVKYEQIRNYLNKELAGIRGRKGEMVEQIAGDNKYIRINLYTFKYENGDPDSLARLVFRSCRKEPRGKEKLENRMELAAAFIRQKDMEFDYVEFNQYLQNIKRNNYPVPHHSKKYINKYDPAYRVISYRVYKKYFTNCFQD